MGKTALLESAKRAQFIRPGVNLRTALQHFLHRVKELQGDLLPGQWAELELLRERVMNLSESNQALYDYMNGKWIGREVPMDMDEHTPEEVDRERARIDRRVGLNLFKNAVGLKDPAVLLSKRREAAAQYMADKHELVGDQQLLQDIDNALAAYLHNRRAEGIA
jgi:hypothetical protein